MRERGLWSRNAAAEQAEEVEPTAIFPERPNRQSAGQRHSFAAAVRPLSRDREGLWEKRGRGKREKEAGTQG